MLHHSILTLAQTDAPPSIPPSGDSAPVSSDGAAGSASTVQPGSTTPAQPKGSVYDMLPMFVLIAGAFIMLIVLPARSQRKERKKVEEMLGALKKGDRVQTIGGELGTVDQVRDDEVVLRFNESTRISYVRAAIQRVIDPNSEKDGEKKA